MAVEIVTKEDLEIFKHELLSMLQEFLNSTSSTAQKKWLRSQDVRKLLNISAGTLQNLRITGALRYTKIGGTMFYRYDDLEKMMRADS